MIFNESTIRDKLAENLDIIESGLRLVAKEYYLKNEFGANGSIDILAKDEYDNYVVIELKRSNQAARQGIHELFKYLSILTAQLGVGTNKVRAILISTTWHELKVPFAEYLKSTPYYTIGLQLNIDSSGTPLSTSRIPEVVEQHPLKISPQQKIYLYKNKQSRDKMSAVISDAFTSAGIKDHFLIHCDHKDNDPQVIFKHGIYLVFSSPFLTLNDHEIREYKKRINWDSDLYDPEENFLCAVSNDHLHADSVEIGYPEKLRIISDSWSLFIGDRKGRFALNNELVTDDELINDAMGIDGGSSFYFYKTTSPKFVKQWSQAINNLKQVALGNSLWQKAVSVTLKEIQKNDNDAKVSIASYNTANTPLTLYALCNNKFDYTPFIQIVSKESKGTRFIFSIFQWNNIKITISPDGFFDKTYGSFTNWMAYQHFGETFIKDDSARKNSHIDYPLFEIWLPDADVEQKVTINSITLINGKIKKVLIPQLPNENHDCFIHKNHDFFIPYENMMSSIMANTFK